MPPTAPGELFPAAGTNYLTVAQALALAATVPSAAIDWAAGSLFKKTITGNTTLTFSNVTVGQIIRFFLTRAALSGFGVNWPSGFTWTGGAAAPVDAPGFREIVITCTGVGAYTGSHTSRASDAVNSGMPGPYPSASLVGSANPPAPAAAGELMATASLHIPATGTVNVSGGLTSGQTVTIGGVIYSSLVPDNGAATRIFDDAAGLVEAINGLRAGVAADANVSAAAVGTLVTLTARAGGTAGNAITLAKSGAALTLSGALLTGGVNVPAAPGSVI